ncbi:MAG: hypothetical protein ACFCU5_05480 [Pleurocapsa sp.]
MNLIICPGIHSQQLTQSFLQDLQSDRSVGDRLSIFPTEIYPAYCAPDIYRWLQQIYIFPANAPALTFITFSAGVVGGIGAAIAWQMQGGKIKAFIALDGWGVPLVADFPIYRLSHDFFTHWSSAILGGGSGSFYCDPPVEHLTLWRSPKQCWGWQIIEPNFRVRCSAAQYIHHLLS